MPGPGPEPPSSGRITAASAAGAPSDRPPCPISSPPSFPGSHLVVLVFGLALLLAGRRIFWLVLGVIGFLFGFDLADRVLGLDPHGLGLLVALFAGIVGIFVALFLQKVAIGITGFVVGGYLALVLLHADPANLATRDLLAFLIGGIVCAVVALWLFEIALILLSSLAGAALVEHSAGLAPSAALVAYVVLVLVGVAVQAGIGPRRRRRRLRDAE